jgi:hypothetical protein
MKKTYKIMAHTESYIANRDSMFNGKCDVTLESGLTLKEAHKRLLDLFNTMYRDEYYAANWGMAVLLTRKRAFFGASPTFRDGTRSFEYDGRRFHIEEDGN